MIDMLSPYKWVLDLILVAALCGGVTFAVHEYNNHQQGIGEARKQAEWDADKLAKADAKEELRKLRQEQKDEADKQGAKDLQLAVAAADSANRANRVLDSTVKELLRRSGGDSLEANRKYTAALSEVFDDCRARYQTMGRQTQGHADDSLKFDRSWPTK